MKIYNKMTDKNKVLINMRNKQIMIIDRTKKKVIFEYELIVIDKYNYMKYDDIEC